MRMRAGESTAAYCQSKIGNKRPAADWHDLYETYQAAIDRAHA